MTSSNHETETTSVFKSQRLYYRELVTQQKEGLGSHHGWWGHPQTDNSRRSRSPLVGGTKDKEAFLEARAMSLELHLGWALWMPHEAGGGKVWFLPNLPKWVSQKYGKGQPTALSPDNIQQSRRRGRRDLSPRLLHVASDFLTEHSNFKVQTHHLEYLWKYSLWHRKATVGPDILRI